MKSFKWWLALLILAGVFIGVSRSMSRARTALAPRPAVRPKLPAAAPAPLLSVEAVQRQGTLAPAPVEQAGKGLLSAAKPAEAPARHRADYPGAFDGFQDWVERYTAAADSDAKAALLDEGVQLAIARRALMAKLIESDPQRALELAAPWHWRKQLPPAVCAYLEQPLSGRGSLEVYCALPLPGADYKEFHGSTIRYATLGGQAYRAYVYGRRVRQMTQKDIPLHGIVVERAMAVSEEPLRVMEPEEAKAALAGGVVPAETCALCAAPASRAGTPTLADYGGQTLTFCCAAHAADMSRTLMGAEALPPATLAWGNVWTSPPPASPVASFGTKRVLYIRAVFADNTVEPITEAEATAEMNEVNEFYVEMSYNKTALITDVTPLLTLSTTLDYDARGAGAIAADAGAMAWNAGYDTANYDIVIIRHPNVPSFTWGGLGGGGTVWLQYNGAGMIAHEIGHCYGLPHANFWNTRRGMPLPPNPNNLPFDTDSMLGHETIIGPGDDVEYGDIYDIMGGGGGESNPGTQSISTLAGHVNVIGKSQLGWLPDSYVIALSDSGSSSTNRLYAFDVPRLVDGRAYALRVRKDAQREYWVSARSRLANPWLQNGLELHWGLWQQSLGYSSLLDVTPDSKYGANDSAILVGHTYADLEAAVYVTPVAKGGQGTNLWFDVVVSFGPFVSNVPPIVQMSASTNRVGRGQPITFSAAASDPNGDPMVFFWDFGDGTYGTNAATVSKAWLQSGGYVVRCEVSDTKGGVTSKHLAVQVGATNMLSISGRVIDTFGNPLANVRVHNGSITNNDFGDDYQWTYTDSDGAFTLTGFATNTTWELAAFYPGYRTKPSNFRSPLTLADKNAEGLEFLANPFSVVRVSRGADAVKGGNAPGVFNFTRTGDTNRYLQAFFLLGGTATSQDYQALTNTVRQGNAVPGPFGTKSSTYKFYYVDFQTGVVTTNITIVPATNTPPGDNKSVVCTLMWPLEITNIMLTNMGGTTMTNTNTVQYTGWEVIPVDNVDTWFATYPDYNLRWRSEATLLILDQPSFQPVISIVASDATASENANDSGNFTITRSGRLDAPVTVSLQVGGAATPGDDYKELPTSVVLAALQTSANLPVVVRPDLYLEGNETVVVTVVPDATYKIGAGSATVTIVDNDLPMVTIDSPDNVASESGNTGSFVVTRTGDMISDLTVAYLATGTAVSGQDYRALPSTVTIPAGQPSATITVQPRNNGIRDGGNTVTVIISDSPLYNVGWPNNATVFIQDAGLPTVSVTASPMGAAEPGTATEFTISRIGSATKELVVNIQTTGTARPLGDYAPVSSQVRIPAGASSTTVTIAPVEDPWREDPETVILTILPGADYNVGANYQATATIDDSDGGFPGVGFNFPSSSVFERSKEAWLLVSVSADPADNQDVTVDWMVTGGTALPDVDYSSLSSTGQMVFPHGGNRTQILKFPILDNTNAQPDRTVIITLIPPAPIISNEIVTNIVQDTNDPPISITNLDTNVTVTPVPMNAFFDLYSSHTLTILDDDAAIITVEATDPLANEADSKPGIFTIKRAGPTNRAQTVYFQLSGSAANGSDYQTLTSPVVIPVGEASLDLLVAPLDDPIQEYMESVTITLLSTPGAQLGSATTATVNIVDNDGTIEFDSPAYSCLENVGVAQIPVRRTGDSNVTDTVDFIVSAGTATANVDFVATNGTLTFYPGEALKYIPVTILDDTIVEPPKTVNLTLQNVTGGWPLGGQTTAMLSLVDDDTNIEFDQAIYRANEDSTNALITLRRTGVFTNLVSVELVATNDVGTNQAATAGEDFVGTNLTVYFQPGQTSVTAQVRLLDDALFEGDETVMLYLTNAAFGAALGARTNATLVIVDDECALEFAAPAYQVMEYARLAVVDVRRTGGTVNPVQVDFATSDGTATAGKDYVAAQGTLAFAGDAYVPAPDGSGQLLFQPGETNKSIYFRILDDSLGEGDETFKVTLKNPRSPARNALTNSTVLGPQTNTVVTIIDDEVPGQVDFAFNPGQGADGPVWAVAVQVDGKVLLGGDFTTVDGVVLNRIARVHDDGYLDSSFDPGAGTDRAVVAIAVQPDGKVLIGGDFTRVGTANLSRIARLNADGTVDGAFNPGLGADGAVRAIALQPDGKILLGGSFATVAGISRQGIARLNADGSGDTGFDPGAGASDDVLAVAVQSDGKILLGGAFTSVGDASRPYLARLNPTGSPDKAFIAGTGPDALVRSITVQGDGRIVIGGDFIVFSNIGRKHVARLNADGSVDMGFDPGSGADGSVYAVGVQQDGKVILGGAFTNVNDLSRNRFVRLNPNGTVDTGFQMGTGANDLVRALAVQPDTALILGGDFTVVEDLPRARIARIHGDEKFVLSAVQFSSPFYQVPKNGGQATITVVRSGELQTTVSVDYLALDGTAIAGTNYVATSGTLQFAPGQTETNFAVPIIDNKLAEGDLTVNLVLTNLPPGYSLSAQLTAVLTIQDYLSAVAFSKADYTVNQGAGVATITLRRSGPSTNVVSVDYATHDGTATNGVDYTAVSGVLQFNAGDTTQTFEVPILNNDSADSDRTVLLELSNPQGGAVLGKQNTATLTIVHYRVPFYSLNISPPAGGTVTPPSGPYPAGSTQTVAAVPDLNFAFVRWEGTTNSTANPLVLIMDRNYNLTALFQALSYTYSFEPPFSAADLAAAPWFSYSEKPWVLASGVASSGNCALRSGVIGDGEQTILGLSVTTRAGAASFDFRVSSEQGWDFLEFYLNGVRLERWSGDVPWRPCVFLLAEGRNTLVWRYVKDANFSSGLDAAFVDNVYVPLPIEVKPEALLAIKQLPAGVMQIQLQGKPGLPYVLQGTANFVDWTVVFSNVVPSGTVLIQDPQSTNQPWRFYRAFTP